MLLTLFLISLSTAPALKRCASQYQTRPWASSHHIREISIDGQQFGIILDMASMLMNMQLAKVCAKLLLLLKANISKVLAAEDNDASLSREKGQFVLLLRGERAQL